MAFKAPSLSFLPICFETTTFVYDTLAGRLRELAYLNKGLRISLEDTRAGQERKDSFCYEGGIIQFVEYVNSLKHANLIHENVIYMKAEKGDITAEVALQYNDTYTESIITFANNMATVDGGTHDVGFKNALTKVTNQYARKLGFLKDADKNLSGEDAREGICAIVSVKLPDAQFESQTKAKLGNTSIGTLVRNIVNDKLYQYLEEHPNEAKIVIEKAIAASNAREAAQKARDASRNKEVVRKAAVAHANYKVPKEELKHPLKKIVGVIRKKLYQDDDTKK